ELRAEALIDTGFDGAVILPRAQLPLGIGPPDSTSRWILGDSVSRAIAPSYFGTAELDGTGDARASVISFIGTEAMVGRDFVSHFRVILDHGQRVIVEV